MRSPLITRRTRAAALALFAAPFASSLFAVDYYKANNTSSFNAADTTTTPSTSVSWVTQAGGPLQTIPSNTTTSPDSWIFDNRVQVLAADGVSAPVFNMGNDLGVRNIIIGTSAVATPYANAGSPAYPITINGGGNRTLTVANGGGIDLTNSTVNLTIENLNTASNTGLRLPGSNTVLNLAVPAGRTLTINSNVAVQNGSSGATVNFNGGGSIVVGGEFKPSNAVINAGTVTFNRLTGSTRLGTSVTTVNGGTLVVGNTSGSATGSGAVAVNDTATLAGTGIISGAVTAASGSTLSPGVGGVGTLTVGTLTLASGSNYVWEATDAATADRVAVTASNGLTINGGTIKLYQPGTTTPFNGTGVFTLFTCPGTPVGSVDSLVIDEATKIPGRTYTLSLGANAVTLRITNGAITPIAWAVDADGNWSAGSNWTGGAAPDALSALARITGPTGATLTAPRTVTLDAPRTVGQLVLDSSQPVTLAGSSTLTLNDDGASATLSSTGADHVVNTPIALTTGGVLATVEDASKTLTLGGVVSGAGLSLVKSGAGTLLLTANNTYTGSTSVSAGTLQIGAGGASGSVAGPVATSGVLRFNRSDSVGLASVISGSGSVEFTGSGDTTLSAANTYSGGTTLSAGTLILANSLALQGSTLTYNTGGGTLAVADPVTAITLGGLAGNRAIPLANTALAPIALTVGGNNASTTYSGSPSGSGASFTKTGTGTLSLTGSHTYTGNTTVSAGVLSIDAGATFTTAAADLGTGSTALLRVAGGTLNATSSLMPNASVGLAVSSGTANFSGTIANETGNSSNEPFINVTGGTLNAAAISLSRGSLNISSVTPPASGQTAQGLYINGGAVNITGALGIGAISGANSSVSARIDSGSLTVGGPLTLGLNNAAIDGTTGAMRWSVLDVNNGTLTSTDATQGILVGGPFAGQVIMHMRGSSAVVNAHRIQFGQAALAGRSYFNLAGGALYVGAGGMPLGSTAPSGTGAGLFDAYIALGNGTLGATADWTSPITLKLQGVPSVLTGADASDTPHTITLSGVATGSGEISKTGSGTVLLTNSSNNYGGAVTVDGGTLGLAGTAAFGITVNSAGTLRPVGVLTSSFGATIEGRLSITYDGSNATTPVSRLESGFPVVLGGSSSLKVTGTGNLAGPAYPIITGGVSGTFATVDLPAGLAIDYAYDHDNDAGTATVVALVGSIAASPYDAWTTSFSLTGNDALASADPDGDGLANLLEFAFSSSPIAANPAPWTISRSGNFLTLSFNHPANSGLSYSVEAVNDLTGTWTPVHSFPTFTTAGTATYTDTVDLNTAGTRRFLRLKITPAP